MTKILLEQITKIEDLTLFSKAYQEGLIQINTTKILKHLNKDRKTVKKYLSGQIPKKTRQREKYLDQHRDYISD